MRVCSGFLLFESVLYIGIALCVLTVITGTTAHMIQWYKKSQEHLGFISAHHRAYMIILNDVGNASSSAIRDGSWYLSSSSYDEEGHATRWEVVYTHRRDGLYRTSIRHTLTASVKSSCCLVSSLHALTITQESSDVHRVLYQPSTEILWSNTTPIL